MGWDFFDNIENMKYKKHLLFLFSRFFRFSQFSSLYGLRNLSNYSKIFISLLKYKKYFFNLYYKILKHKFKIFNLCDEILNKGEEKKDKELSLYSVKTITILHHYYNNDFLTVKNYRILNNIEYFVKMGYLFKINRKYFSKNTKKNIFELKLLKLFAEPFTLFSYNYYIEFIRLFKYVEYVNVHFKFLSSPSWRAKLRPAYLKQNHISGYERHFISLYYLNYLFYRLEFKKLFWNKSVINLNFLRKIYYYQNSTKIIKHLFLYNKKLFIYLFELYDDTFWGPLYYNFYKIKLKPSRMLRKLRYFYTDIRYLMYMVVLRNRKRLKKLKRTDPNIYVFNNRADSVASIRFNKFYVMNLNHFFLVTQRLSSFLQADVDYFFSYFTKSLGIIEIHDHYEKYRMCLARCATWNYETWIDTTTFMWYRTFKFFNYIVGCKSLRLYHNYEGILYLYKICKHNTELVMWRVFHIILIRRQRYCNYQILVILKYMCLNNVIKRNKLFFFSVFAKYVCFWISKLNYSIYYRIIFQISINFFFFASLYYYKIKNRWQINNFLLNFWQFKPFFRALNVYNKICLYNKHINNNLDIYLDDFKLSSIPFTWNFEMYLDRYLYLIEDDGAFLNFREDFFKDMWSLPKYNIASNLYWLLEIDFIWPKSSWSNKFYCWSHVRFYRMRRSHFKARIRWFKYLYKKEPKQKDILFEFLSSEFYLMHVNLPLRWRRNIRLLAGEEKGMLTYYFMIIFSERFIIKVINFSELPLNYIHTEEFDLNAINYKWIVEKV